MDGSIGRRFARRHTPPVDESLAAVGLRIRELRQRARLSQAAIGEPYLTRGAVSSIEHGRSVPSLRTLAHFARKLKVHMRELFPDDR